jgi:NAD(P)-dependent dehydrogenase (short-subunit alcohol dehydrogenase family)
MVPAAHCFLYLTKVAIVTGGNTGLGKEVVRHLALHNAKVYMATRTESRALSSIQELEKDHPEFKGRAAIVFLQIDLTSLVSCQTAARAFLEKEERLDMLGTSAFFWYIIDLRGFIVVGCSQ